MKGSWAQRSRANPRGRSSQLWFRRTGEVPHGEAIIIALHRHPRTSTRRAAYDNSIKPVRRGGSSKAPPMLEAFLVSTFVVAVGELGDKTQLLTLVLAARYPQAVADYCRHPRGDAGQPRHRGLDRSLGARRCVARGAALGTGAVVLRRGCLGAQAGPVRCRRPRHPRRTAACSRSRRSRSSWRKSATRRRSPPRCSPRNSIPWSQWSRARHSACCWSMHRPPSLATRPRSGFPFAPCASSPQRCSRDLGVWALVAPRLAPAGSAGIIDG